MVDNKFPGKDITESDIKEKFPLCAKKNKNHYSKFEVAGVEFGGDTIPVIAKNEFKIPIITEVMEERYIELIAGVADIIQIGSRNMQNYPLLTACAKTGKPIMLKRHYGASLRDWLGAAEYILYEGNDKLILCERGVSIPHTHRSTSRFALDLQVVPAAKEITHLPIVVDPSHATFWRPWVNPMSLAAIASGADGIMLEVHPDPDNSAVDPLQPINYEHFSKLIKKMDTIAKSIYDRKIL